MKIATIKPIELSLVARNNHGQLRCYSLNIVDFLDSTPFSPRLHLKYTWLGHQHSISKLYQSQKNRFCTIGIDGQINVWKYELREVIHMKNPPFFYYGTLSQLFDRHVEK